MRSKWIVGMLVGLVALSLAVGGVVAAQGPQGGTGAAGEQYVDENGDGVCDVCGSTGTGAAMRWGGRGAMGGGLMEAVAEVTGLSVDEISARLQSGETVLDVITSSGATVDDVANALVADREAALAAAVEAGRITQEQADLMLQNMQMDAVERLSDSSLSCLSGDGVGSGMMRGAGHKGGGHGAGRN